MKKVYGIILFSILIFINSTFAQTPKKTWVIHGNIETITTDSIFTYLGGNFNYLGPVTGSGAKITTYNTQPDPKFPFVNGYIAVCVPDGNGGWFIGGYFDKVGKYNRKGLAQINADGSVSKWNPGATGVNPTNQIGDIAVDDSVVYVSGSFTTIGGVKQSYLAKIDKRSGKVDENWNPKPNNFVRTLALSKHYVYVGGYFHKIGNLDLRAVARIDKKTGIPDSTWNPSPNGYVYAIALSGNAVYLGGQFTSLKGQGPALKAAKLNKTNGKFFTPFWEPNPDYAVKKIIPKGNKVYLMGFFHHIGRKEDTIVPRNSIVCVDTNRGNPDLLWNPKPDRPVSDMQVAGNKIYLAGAYRTIRGKERRYLVRVDNKQGEINTTWNPNSDGAVLCIGINQDNIYLGGGGGEGFVSVGGIACHNLIRLYNSGYTPDITWLPKPDSSVSAIVSDNRNVYVAGLFNHIGKKSIPYVAKINYYSGNAEDNWGLLVNKPVYSLALKDTALFIGGAFTKVSDSNNNVDFHYLAKIEKNSGKIDTSWHNNPAPDKSGSIRKIEINENYLYASGEFNYGAYNYLKRISVRTGITDPFWNPRTFGTAKYMEFYGNYIYFDEFLYSSGTLAKVDKLTGNAVNWDQPFEIGKVKTLAADNNYLYTGGSFTNVKGLSVKYLARFNLCSGLPDSSWVPDILSQAVWDAGISNLSVSGNNLLYTGKFIRIGKNLRSGLGLIQLSPVPSKKLKVKSIGKGPFSNHAIVICSNGKPYTWGGNQKGQLGTGTYKKSNVPLAVDTNGVLKGKNLVEAAKSFNQSMVLSSDGKIYMWGENNIGQLGNNSTKDSPFPVAVDTTGVLSGKKIIAIAAGGDFSLALDSKGKIYTWGKAVGLGNGSTPGTYSTVPVCVDTNGALKGKKIVAIAAGKDMALALSADGLIYSWGRNDYGQLGNNSSAKYSTVPVMVDTSGALKGKKIIAIAAGFYHGMALTSYGKVYTWGNNQNGQLGNNSNTNSKVPVAVKMSGKNVIAITAGGSFSLALATNGRIYSWGANNVGQLGNSGKESNIPVSVKYYSGVLEGKHIVDIASGTDFSLALSCKGDVYSWGGNTDGQLGNNTIYGFYSKSPVKVLWPITTDVKPIEALQTGLQLSQNFPNPFRQYTTIHYTLPANIGVPGSIPDISLKVYDLTGREVATLVQGKKQPGSYSVPFHAAGLSPGIYFYKLRVGNRILTRKMVIEQ